MTHACFGAPQRECLPQNLSPATECRSAGFGASFLNTFEAWGSASSKKPMLLLLLEAAKAAAMTPEAGEKLTDTHSPALQASCFTETSLL